MSDKDKNRPTNENPQKKEEDDPTKKEDRLKKTGSDEDDIDILKKYGRGPYTEKIKSIEDRHVFTCDLLP